MIEARPPHRTEYPEEGKNLTTRQVWSAGGSMALCVAMLIASECMPVTLNPTDSGATNSRTAQVISIGGRFAMPSSLFIATVAGRFDRHYVLHGLALAMGTVTASVGFELE